MFKKLNDKQRKRLHRKIHIRKSIYGTAERPRMTVFKSGRNLYVQVINDDEGKTLASISTLEKDFVAFFEKENLEKAEFLIPEVVNDMVKDNEVDLIVEKTISKWYGITYKEDLDEFKTAIETMKKNKEYPSHLYGNENGKVHSI